MDVKVENGRLTVNVRDLLSGVSGSDKAELIDALACDDDVIRQVAEQIIGGCTDMGSHGCRGGGALEPYLPLEKARRLIAEQSSEIAAQEIAALKREIVAAQSLTQAGWAEYHALQALLRCA